MKAALLNRVALSLGLLGTLGLLVAAGNIAFAEDTKGYAVKKENRHVGLSESKKETNSTVGQAKISTKIPRFSGDPSLYVSRANTAIKNAVDDEIKKMTSEQKVQEDNFTYNAEGHTNYSGPDFISLTVDYSSFTGGAHGNSYTKSLNFRLQPYKELSLDNVLGGPIDYKILSDLAQIELYKQLKGGDKGMVESGTGPFAKNFDTFTFDKKGVTFYFDPYQVAPYSEGAPTITLPYAVLKPLIKSNSVVYGWTHGIKPAAVAADDTLRSQQKQAALKEFLKRTKA